MKILNRRKCIESKDIGTEGVSLSIIRPHGWKPQCCGGTNEPCLGKGVRFLTGLQSLMNSKLKCDSIIDKLCYIFQVPYHAMLVTFHRYDKSNNGKVSIDECMEIFLEYGFSIIFKDFLQFLKEAGCIFNEGFVKYKQLLDRYQYKQEFSKVNRVIKLMIQTEYEETRIKTLTTMTSIEIEQHLIKLLHGHYIKLMDELQKNCDKDYTVDMETMKIAIERHVLGESIRNDQWNDLLPDLDIDETSGRIPYKKFLYRFSSQSKTCKKLCSQPPISKEKKYVQKKYERDPRDVLYLSIQVERLLKTRFHYIDKYYKCIEKKDLSHFKDYEFHELLQREKSDLTASEVKFLWDIMLIHAPNFKSYQLVMKFMMYELVKIARNMKIKERYDSKIGDEQTYQHLIDSKI